MKLSNVFCRHVIKICKKDDFKLLCLAIISLLLQLSKAETFTNFNETSCHDAIIEDDLPSADSQMQFFPAKSIFFIGTSCKGGIKSREACSIESAARANPNWQINVLFTGPVATKKEKMIPMKILKHYQNVKFFRIHVTKFSKNTPLEQLLTKRKPNLLCRIRHSSDVIKLISLYRWGGVYLDMDVIVMKSFDSLAKNWVARDSDTEIGSSYLGISRDEVGKKFIDSVME